MTAPGKHWWDSGDGERRAEDALSSPVSSQAFSVFAGGQERKWRKAKLDRVEPGLEWREPQTREAPSKAADGCQHSRHRAGRGQGRQPGR